jgi:hypothetical protein
MEVDYQVMSPRVLTEIGTNLIRSDEDTLEQKLMTLDLFYDLRKNEGNQETLA